MNWIVKNCVTLIKTPKIEILSHNAYFSCLHHKRSEWELRLVVEIWLFFDYLHKKCCLHCHIAMSYLFLICHPHEQHILKSSKNAVSYKSVSYLSKSEKFKNVCQFYSYMHIIEVTDVLQFYPFGVCDCMRTYQHTCY